MSKRDPIYSNTAFDLINSSVILVLKVIEEAPEGAEIYARGVHELIMDCYYSFPKELNAISRVNDPRDLPVAKSEAINVLDSYAKKIKAQTRMYEVHGKEPRLTSVLDFFRQAFSGQVNDAIAKRSSDLGG